VVHVVLRNQKLSFDEQESILDNIKASALELGVLLVTSRASKTSLAQLPPSIRITVQAAHTAAQIQDAIAAIKQAANSSS
jgi:7-keto-8-aminopelargonate synthetase-like enzyme